MSDWVGIVELSNLSSTWEAAPPFTDVRIAGDLRGDALQRPLDTLVIDQTIKILLPTDMNTRVASREK